MSYGYVRSMVPTLGGPIKDAEELAEKCHKTVRECVMVLMHCHYDIAHAYLILTSDWYHPCIKTDEYKCEGKCLSCVSHKRHIKKMKMESMTRGTRDLEMEDDDD